MARRKRVLDDADDSDSSADEGNYNHNLNEDPDLAAERELFENPYKHKRRRKNGKEDAIYGVFGSDSDNDDNYKPGSSSSRRTHWTKAPAFVSGEKKVELKKEEEDVTMIEKDKSEDDNGEV
jgi:tuftelin-interacting protein 11